MRDISFKNELLDLGEFFKLKNGQSIFKCKFCKNQFEFKNLDLFIAHIKINHVNDKIKCTSISQRTETQSLRKSIDVVNKEFKFKSDNNINNNNYNNIVNTDKSTNSEYNCESFEEKTVTISYSCTNSKLTLKEKSECKNKTEKSQDSVTQKAHIGMYESLISESEFTMEKECKIHANLHKLDKSKENQFKNCGKKENSNAGSKIHLLQHSATLLFQCSICQNEFKTASALKLHEQSHYLQKEFKCEQCDKRYRRCMDLKKHKRQSHLNEKPSPVMCDLCGKSFADAFNFKYHMRRHLNVKPIKCDKCDKTFVERGDLNKHLITHNPDFKPFICEICSKSFSRKITLTKHQKLHSGLKEYICKICGKAFAQSPGLYMHMKSHGFNIKPRGGIMKNNLM